MFFNKLISAVQTEWTREASFMNTLLVCLALSKENLVRLRELLRGVNSRIRLREAITQQKNLVQKTKVEDTVLDKDMGLEQLWV